MHKYNPHRSTPISSCTTEYIVLHGQLTTGFNIQQSILICTSNNKTSKQILLHGQLTRFQHLINYCYMHTGQRPQAPARRNRSAGHRAARPSGGSVHPDSPRSSRATTGVPIGIPGNRCVSIFLTADKAMTGVPIGIPGHSIILTTDKHIPGETYSICLDRSSCESTIELRYTMTNTIKQSIA